MYDYLEILKLFYIIFRFASSIPDAPEIIQELNSDVQDRHNYIPHDYFLNYIDDNMYKLIADCTNRTCVMKNRNSLNITASEVKTFVGITLLMSTLGFP